MTDDAEKKTGDQEQPLIAHLAELRDRLLRCLLCILVLFLGLAAFSNDIYTIVATPLLDQLPEGSTLIATEIASPFFVPFKLTLFVSLFLAMPYLLYQAWAFVVPGLYENEQLFVFPLLLTSIALFYLGTAFAFFIVFPLVFGFFPSVAPTEVTYMPDIKHHLDFMLKMFFAFGMAFEVPIATILVIKSGFTTAESLKEKRPYIIVGAFALGMLLTPPDIISQFLLATPVWLLFELGLVLSKYVVADEDEPEENVP